MKIRAGLAIAGLLLLAVRPAIADAWDDINAAHRRGDDETAFRLAIERAEQGDARAQSFVGYLYETGKGVEEDQVKAVHWYQRGADQGEATAQANLCNAYYDGDGLDRDMAEALHWCRLAADQKDEFALYNLGRFHLHGDGVEPDFVQAYKWFALSQQAARHSSLRKLAGDGMADAEERLTPAQLEQAKRMVADWKPNTP